LVENSFETLEQHSMFQASMKILILENRYSIVAGMPSIEVISHSFEAALTHCLVLWNISS
jgi:hypothetical protein